MKIRDIWLGSGSASGSVFAQLGTADIDCDADADPDSDTDTERLGYSSIFEALIFSKGNTAMEKSGLPSDRPLS
jgi:hypothetical protein